MLDVGPSMSSAPPGEATGLQTAIQAITMILQRKVGTQSDSDYIIDTPAVFTPHMTSRIFMFKRLQRFQSAVLIIDIVRGTSFQNPCAHTHR